MLEGDYVWMKPLPAPRADSDSPSWAFPFSYIGPQAPHLEKVMRLMYPEDEGPLTDIPNSGPAPVLMRVHEWRKARKTLTQSLPSSIYVGDKQLQWLLIASC